jgi:AraC-like DNA-binding protein
VYHCGIFDLALTTDIMRNEFARASSSSGIAAMRLDCIWQVTADASYDVYCHREQPGVMIALRTLSGRGEVRMSSGKRLRVTAGTLVFLTQGDIRRYRCFGNGWEFNWFEFTFQQAFPFPLERVLQLALRSDEDREVEGIMQNLRRDDRLRQSLASAEFACVFYRWLADYERSARQTPHTAIIERVIEKMYARLSHSWRVAEMAVEAGLSERRFRQVFRQATGVSPKQFYDNLRLEAARQLLRFTGCTVEEAANRLGFSSAFHLSRAYHQHFGVRPSAEK